MKNVPLVNLKTQYKNIKPEIDRAIKRVLNSTQFILGKDVKQFEDKFAKFCDTRFAIGMDNGSSALELGMRALGIGQGDEVLTPANSFIASSSSISFVGARPILVDCDETTYNIDPSKVEEKINKKTKAIMPVHLYGQPANMQEIKKLARKHKLLIIEDACQAHGASYRGKRVGSFGHIAAFSFYPGKNLGAYGDGGLATTNNKKIAEKLRMMRDYGQKGKYNHAVLAWNRRLDNLQAAILLVKLKYLNQWNNARRNTANLYTKLLESLPVTTPLTSEDVKHVFHLYVVRTKKRDELLKYLRTRGIGVGIHYPIPIHLQKAYKHLGHKKGDFPITEKASQEILSLPIFPEMKEGEVEAVVKNIKNFFKTNS